MGEDAALGDRRCGPAARSGASRSVVARSVAKVLRSRLLMPISWRIELQAPGRARPRHALRRARPCRGHARRRPSSRAIASSTAAMMMRMQSAPQRARLDHLIGIEHEVLAQHRQLRRRARRGQIFGGALERGRVGQHREAGGAARFIGAGERRRIEIGADQALRRARLLDLGDQREVAMRDAAHCSASAKGRTGGGGTARSRIDICERPAPWRRRSLALVGKDLVEHVGHRLRLYHGSAERALRARPAPRRCRSTRAASATPSRSDCALPATSSAAAAFSSTISRKGPLLPSKHARGYGAAFSIGIAAGQILRLGAREARHSSARS